VVCRRERRVFFGGRSEATDANESDAHASEIKEGDGERIEETAEHDEESDERRDAIESDPRSILVEGEEDDDDEQEEITTTNDGDLEI